uniref:Uncharacterized protein n=1 Tax=viral metagenome TaxID=1070528 RepID=A0A6M3IF22_9ZZZZ
MAGRDTPSVIYGTQEDYKRLYYSDHMASRRVPVTVMAGYGVLKMGLAMALNGSAAGDDGKLMPYDPTAITGAEYAPGRAYLVQSSGTTATVLYVTMDDSYKFTVADDVYIADNTTTAENLGAITAIDRTTYTHMAAITVTTATGSDSFTTARFAYIAVEGYATCVGILEKSVDTGTGVNAKGANAMLIRGNAVLYTGMLTNFDAAAIADLSARSWGQFTELL